MFRDAPMGRFIVRQFVRLACTIGSMAYMKFLRVILPAVLFLSVTGFTDCYKPVTNSGLPTNIRTVAIPAFQFEANALRYRVESRFTEAVTKEIIRRGSGLKVQG